MMRKLILLALTFCLTIGLSATSLASQDVQDFEGSYDTADTTCTGSAHAPHYSRGAPGIIFKASFQCGFPGSRITVSGHLYKCVTSPANGSTAARRAAGCLHQFGTTYPEQIAWGDQKYTKYFPQQILPGLPCRNGWWLGIAVFKTPVDVYQDWAKNNVQNC